MENNIDQFIKARDHIYNTIKPKIETFLLGTWDPINKYNVIKETTDIIHDDLIQLFPDLPERFLPRCRFRVFQEEHEVEVGIQNYYNMEAGLTFLGTSEIGNEIFDFYFRNSYDPRFEYMFIARYGHAPDDFFNGSKTAEAEYYLGQYTPLSVAYGIAIEDGFIG